MIVLRSILLLLSFSCSLATQCDIAQECITDLTQEDCGPGYILVPGSSIYNCCPSCQLESSVIPNPDACQAPASCTPDGKYAPVQCKGDVFTGRCFCSDEDGNRIFGQMWRSDGNEMTCGRQVFTPNKMNRITACSRRRWEMEKQGRSDVTLHCTSTGDYEPLQCDSGICWCAASTTGQPTASPVPLQDMKLLPCYSSAVTGEQYLRRCESLAHAFGEISKEQSYHGTTFLGKPGTYCDYDGSYAPKQIKGTSAWCTGRDGEILGAWQASATQIDQINCNCARDSAVYFPERGIEMTATCLGNGNYQPNQSVGDVQYCVDKDGYPIPCTSHA